MTKAATAFNQHIECKLQVDNGLNVNASEGLSSGQKSTVLRATGDKQYIDSYGIFKRNRTNISEEYYSISSSDNCMTAGPITINNGNTSYYQ